MNFLTKNPNQGFFFFFFLGGGGGGGGSEEAMNTRAAIFYTQDRHIVTSSKEPYSLMKIFQTVFKIQGIVALTIKGK